MTQPFLVYGIAVFIQFYFQIKYYKIIQTNLIHQKSFYDFYDISE